MGRQAVLVPCSGRSFRQGKREVFAVAGDRRNGRKRTDQDPTGVLLRGTLGTWAPVAMPGFRE